MDSSKDAAGVIPYRMKDGEIELLLVQDAYTKKWNYPKGRIEEGESIFEAALRELREETKLTPIRVHDHRPLNQYYSFRDGKEVVQRHVQLIIAEIDYDAQIILQYAEVIDDKWCTLDVLKCTTSFDNVQQNARDAIRIIESQMRQAA